MEPQADTIPLNTDPNGRSADPNGMPTAGSGTGSAANGSGDRVHQVIGPSQPSPGQPDAPEAAATQPQPAPTQPGPAGLAPAGLAPAGLAPAGPTSPPPVPLAPGRDDRRGGMPRALVAALVVGVLIICSAVALDITTGAIGKLNPFKHGLVQERTIDRSSPAVLRSINDLGQFEAASGYYQLVVDVEKDVNLVPSFLAGRRELFIAAGTVPAGVDLRSLGSAAVQVSANRTSATLTLPKPTLGPPTLDLAHSYVYSQQRGVLNRLGDAVGNGSAEQQQQLDALATQRLSAAAQQSDELITRAETNTRSMLQGLLRSLGFTDVTINFAG